MLERWERQRLEVGFFLFSFELILGGLFWGGVVGMRVDMEVVGGEQDWGT